MAAAQLITAGLTSNEQGWTDCAYLHAKDLDALAYAAGLDPASVAKRGMLAAVGEAVLYVRFVLVLITSCVVLFHSVHNGPARGSAKRFFGSDTSSLTHDLANLQVARPSFARQSARGHVSPNGWFFDG